MTNITRTVITKHTVVTKQQILQENSNARTTQADRHKLAHT